MAAPPTKDECIEAHSRGQDARESSQLAEAKRLFLICAQASCPALVQSDCAKFGDELTHTLPSLTFAARDSAGVDLVDTQVYVDGALAVTRLDDARAHDVNPGKHSIRFVHAGKEFTQLVVVNPGEKDRTIVATFGGEGSSSSGPPVGRSAEPARGPSPSPLPLVVAGIGGAAVIVGTILAITGANAVPSNCSLSSRHCSAPPGDASFSDAGSAVRQANLGIGIGVVGLAIAASGLIWYFVGTPERKRESTAAGAMNSESLDRRDDETWRLSF
jgi:hypothetical protein